MSKKLTEPWEWRNTLFKKSRHHIKEPFNELLQIQSLIFICIVWVFNEWNKYKSQEIFKIKISFLCNIQMLKF